MKRLGSGIKQGDSRLKDRASEKRKKEKERNNERNRESNTGESVEVW